MKKTLLVPVLLATAMLLPACAMTPTVDHAAVQESLKNRKFAVIENNSGLYMSPYTSDGVAAAWVEKSINAQMGSSLGGAAGAYAGQKALEQVPFVGGFLGQKLGAEAGRKIAIASIGGEAFLKSSSDISFNDINEMAGWLAANYATHPKFQEVFKAATKVYPELQQAYLNVMMGKS